jgi:uncharacterized membrane protein/protein-disulfide isomerase
MNARTPLILFALLGFGSSLTSTYVHYNLLQNPSYASFCDVNATVSCTQAYLSPYGSLFGVPVAVAGVFFFAVVLALAALSGRKTRQAGESAPAYIFALSTVGLAVVLYLGYASFFVLHAVCVLCAVTYVAVIALFLISGRATSFPMSALPARAPKDVRTLVSSPAALVLAVLFVVGGASAIAAFPREQAPEQAAQLPAEPLTDQQKAEIERWWDVQPKVDVPVPSDGVKVLMVKFNDYQCPPCRQTFEAYGPLIEKWTKTGQFKFVLKHFPLDAECNGAAPNTPHPAACEAAAAIVMARRKNDGSADKLEHWLFSHQTPLLTPDQVKDAARDVAGITDFQAKYDGALLEVRNDAGMGVMLGVKSTPTFFINGRILPGGYDPRLIDAVIDLEMKRAK